MGEKVKIAALGPHREVIALKSVGVRVFEVEDGADAGKKLQELAAEEAFSVILLSESTAEDIGFELVESVREQTGKVVMAIPSHEGSTGVTERWLKHAMEHSLGVDLITD